MKTKLKEKKDKTVFLFYVGIKRVVTLTKHKGL